MFGEGGERMGLEVMVWLNERLGWVAGGEKYYVLGGCGLWVLQHLFDCTK